MEKFAKIRQQSAMKIHDRFMTDDRYCTRSAILQHASHPYLRRPVLRHVFIFAIRHRVKCDMRQSPSASYLSIKAAKAPILY